MSVLEPRVRADKHLGICFMITLMDGHYLKVTKNY